VKFAEERIAAIEPRLSRLTVALAPGSDDPNLQLSLDGLAIGRAAVGIPTPVDPGKHMVEARAPGKKPWSETVEVGATADAKVVTVPVLEVEPQAAPELAPVAPPPSTPPARVLPKSEEVTRPTPTSVYVAAGTTAALAVAAGVTGVVYLNQRASFNADGRNNPDREAAAAEQDSVRTLGVVNAVLWIATAGGAGLTAYLYFNRPEQRRETARISLDVDPTRLGLSVTGTL
jgi:hypothetical protein